MKLAGYSWRNLLLFFIPWFYLYIRVVNSYITFVFTHHIEGRANYIILFTLIGLILMRSLRINMTLISAFFFTIYMMIPPILEGTANIVTYMASYIVWPVIFFITYNMNYAKKDLEFIGYAGAITCNVIAFLYIFLTNANAFEKMAETSAVASYNAIYYVLLCFPFAFLIRNQKHLLLLSLLPIASFFISTKSTCILAAVAIVVYYVFGTFRNVAFSKKLHAVLIIVIIMVVLSFFLDFSSTVLSMQEDFDSGGNGRTRIASEVLDRYWDHSSLAQLIVGHGSNAVAKTIHIGAHNDFLETLYNYGLLGLLLFIAFWYQLIKNVRRFASESVERKAYVISLIVFFMCCMASKLLGTQIQMILPAILWGMLLKRTEKNE